MTDIESQIAANWDIEEYYDATRALKAEMKGTAVPPADPLDELRELRTQVHRTRQAETEAKRQANEFYTAYLAASVDARGQLHACHEDVVLAEATLREVAERWYEQHGKAAGNKKPITGVGIRENTDYAYDPEVAVTWAVEHKIKGALALNKTGFEKVAAAAPGDVPFVTISKIPTATISPDLAAAMAAEEQLP